jgi:hypothetical protein
MVIGWPVASRTFHHNSLSTSIFLRFATAIGIGIRVNWSFQNPTTKSVFPARAA